MWRLVILFLATIWYVGVPDVYGQRSTSSKLSIYYQVNRSEIDINYQNNKQILTQIISVFDESNLPYIRSVRIEAYASPEGPLALNEKLSWKRAYSLKSYILKRCPQVKDSCIEVYGLGENWNGLHHLITTDSLLPRKQEVLAKIDSLMSVDPSLLNASIRKTLKCLGDKVWIYMVDKIFPQLRVEALITFYIDRSTPSSVQKSISQSLDGIKGASVQVDSSYRNLEAKLPQPAQSDFPATLPIRSVLTGKLFANEKQSAGVQTLLAVKTNLLFDVLTALNIELEVPLAQRWSVAGEWTFPWWICDNLKSNSKRHRLQLLHGNVDVKYWLGDREKHPKLDGWFVGVYAGGGKYDFEYKKRGVQGEFYLLTGIMGGMAHRITKHLFMEYAVGLGYLKTDYRHYRTKWGADEKWHPIYKKGGCYHWVGPTKIKVSLGWIIDCGMKRK